MAAELNAGVCAEVSTATSAVVSAWAWAEDSAAMAAVVKA